jgi:uncharacterized membrane protein (UPF0182 family)
LTSNGETPPAEGAWQDGQFTPPNLRLITKVAGGIAVVVLIIVILAMVKSIYTDWLWFDQLGALGVFKKILVMRIWLFFAGSLLAAALLLVNLHFAYRFSWGESILPIPPEMLRMGRIAIIAVAILTVFIMSVVFGVVAQGRWETFLVYMNRVPFDIVDPQFGKDMSFHIAVMPMLHFIQGWLMGLVIAILVAVVGLYVGIFALRGVTPNITPKIRGHIAVLGAFLMLTIAAAHYLDIFELVFSGRGAAPGAGYTDVNARVPVLWLLVAIAVVSAGGFAASIYYGGIRMMVAAFSLWAVIAVMAGGIYPVSFQRVRVNPNEFDREEQFIERAIEATRDAYNLNLIEERVFDFDPTLDPETVAANPETINNIRLWDPRPLRDTYNQIQTFRQYYNFVGVDVDRYRFPDGDVRQVMLAGRELFPERLEEGAQNWVNRKLTYTHGFGVAMSPVNTATDEGRPDFFLQDLPISGDLTVGRPEIYYGENTQDYVVVRTKTPEFDYAGPAEEPQYADYEGSGGVKVGSFFRRAAFAWRFLDFNLLVSGEIESDSKVMFRREIQGRVGAIAPFLKLDSDPYLVVGDGGKLWWIQDAYTTTDRYAYSFRLNDEFNYIRNSLKVLIDAYNGDIHFLVIDDQDPIIKIYRGAFPDLFKDFDEIDALDPSLRDHIRYGFDLFKAQAEVNLRYHMRDPQQFFLRDDLWDRAQEVILTPTDTQVIEPYYIIMKLPGETEAEYILLEPFTPAGGERKNMVAWLAARSDGENYGKLTTFLFPEGQVDGPEQIEGRITADDAIGRELSLLCPEGKLCIRGNLLAIPMEAPSTDGVKSQSMLYVEALYIRAEALTLPELKKVIVADNKGVVMSDTFEESLCILLHGRILVDGEVKCAKEEGVVDTTPPPDTTGTAPPPSDVIKPVLEEVGTEIGKIEQSIEELRTSLDALKEAIDRLTPTPEGGSQ